MMNMCSKATYVVYNPVSFLVTHNLLSGSVQSPSGDVRYDTISQHWMIMSSIIRASRDLLYSPLLEKRNRHLRALQSYLSRILSCRYNDHSSFIQRYPISQPIMLVICYSPLQPKCSLLSNSHEPLRMPYVQIASLCT